MDLSEPHRSSRIETTDRLVRPAIAGSTQLWGASARYSLTIAIGRWLLEQRSPARPTLWKQNQFSSEERFTKPATASLGRVDCPRLDRFVTEFVSEAFTECPRTVPGLHLHEMRPLRSSPPSLR